MSDIKEKAQATLKDSAAMRWLVLFLVSGLMFSTYWFQDFFGGLKGMMESQMGYSSEEFGRIIGLTTIANMFGMIMVGGFVLDKLGLRIAGLLFGGLAVLGGATTALAGAGVFGDSHDTQLIMMIVGRVMFGSGLEVVCVVATTTMVKWFKGYELALAMAINMGFGRLGSAMGLAVSPDISGTVPPAITLAATLLGVTFLMFVIYIFFDVRLEKQQKAAGIIEDGKKKEEGADETEDQASLGDMLAEFWQDLKALATNPSFRYIALLCVAFYAAVFPFIQYAPDILINKFGFSSSLPRAGFSIGGSVTFGTVLIYVGLFAYALLFAIVPSRIKSFGGKIGAIIVIVGTFAGFAYILRDTLGMWFNNGQKTASIIPLGTIVFTPIFGNIVDKKGKAASLMILGSLLLIFAHVSLSLFDSPVLAYLGLFSLGVAFSLVPAAMWPSVAKIVPQKRLGTSYSAMFTVQNWGLGLFFWGLGALVDKLNPKTVESIAAARKNLEAQGLTSAEVANQIVKMKASGEIPQYNYTIPIAVLVLCGVVSIFLAFMLKRADKKQNYGLELPSSEGGAEAEGTQEDKNEKEEKGSDENVDDDDEGEDKVDEGEDEEEDSDKD